MCALCAVLAVGNGKGQEGLATMSPLHRIMRVECRAAAMGLAPMTSSQIIIQVLCPSDLP